ncbi:MAG: hypothetical protein ABH952_08320 [Candidatus Omnitrophota bacterium]
MAEGKLINRGRGAWLILRYIPVSLFSLRMTHATNKGGKTLLVPTPYAFKMTLIDACFRVFDKEEAEIKAREVFDLIKDCEIRFSPPPICIVQNTFIKIRQEDREAPKGLYNSTIAYREFCFYSGGELNVALGVKGFSGKEITMFKVLGSHINCIGKRGSFWQYVGDVVCEGELPKGYTKPEEENVSTREFYWIQNLDDFGEALCNTKDGFERISTYGTGTIKLGEQRILQRTFIPYSFKQSSKHFTRFQKIA